MQSIQFQPAGVNNWGLGKQLLRREAPLKAPSAQSLLGKPNPAAPISTPLIRFGGAINQDYTFEINVDDRLDDESIFLTLRELLTRSMAKASEGDKSSLKLILDVGQTASIFHEAALADTMRFVDRPVDVIVKSMCSVDGLKMLQSATGKRLMYAGAEIYMGPVTIYQSSGTSEQKKASQRLYKDYIEDLKTTVAEKTGESSMNKIVKDFSSDKPLNALQSLWYGKNGLVDAVLVGPNQVVTRKDLEQYYQQKNFSPDDIENFNKSRDNIIKITPAQTLEQYSPASVPALPRKGYQPLSRTFTAQQAGKKALNDSPANNQLTFFYKETPDEVTRLTKLPLRESLTNSYYTPEFSVENAPTEANGTLFRDTVLFNSPFVPSTIRQIEEALLQLDEKKTSQQAGSQAPSNIALLVNSPGGMIVTARGLRDTIQSLNTPVDVIANGMAASCGALLLSSATGNRFATPNARILIHLASSGSETTNIEGLEDSTNSIDQATLDCSSIISQATGRDTYDVYEDMRRVDVWFNPLEALFYGPKGLVDAILVGPDKVLTREKVNEFLLEQFGGDQKSVDAYIERKISEKLDPDVGRRRMSNDRNKEEADPFGTPLKTIDLLSQTKAQPMAEIGQFKASLPTAEDTKIIDYRHVNSHSYSIEAYSDE